MLPHLLFSNTDEFSYAIHSVTPQLIFVSKSEEALCSLQPARGVGTGIL